MIEIVRHTSRNVKRWQDRATCACAGPPPACSKPSSSSARIIGYSDLAKLAIAVERDLAAQRAPIATTTREEAATLTTV